MTRLVLLLLASVVLAASCAWGEPARKCLSDKECAGRRADLCRKGLCRQKCTYNSECASKDCEHEGIKWGGFCKVDRGTECLIDLTCKSGLKCDRGYCIPKKGNT